MHCPAPCVFVTPSALCRFRTSSNKPISTSARSRRMAMSLSRYSVPSLYNGRFAASAPTLNNRSDVRAPAFPSARPSPRGPRFRSLGRAGSARRAPSPTACARPSERGTAWRRRPSVSPRGYHWSTRSAAGVRRGTSSPQLCGNQPVSHFIHAIEQTSCGNQRVDGVDLHTGRREEEAALELRPSGTIEIRCD